ncbi:site-specific integrase [Paenibacillus sp. GP183]|uniref:site-specific integrase n=1 Tax=Paenibacillus sp. GP183 TaxID=1882751 RepID=UPI000A763910|nr:site-specific integrase [Paenibacillus sp. GP183]
MISGILNVPFAQNDPHDPPPVLLIDTKTKAGSRNIDFPEEIIDGLTKHKQRIDLEKSTNADIYKDYDLVVCSEYGTPTDSSNIRRVLNIIIKNSNVPKIRFHDLRHTHATMLLKENISPKIVSERLGHADVRITLDTYSHVLPSMQKETAQLVGKLLF